MAQVHTSSQRLNKADRGNSFTVEASPPLQSCACWGRSLNIEKDVKIKRATIFFFLAFALLQRAHAQDWHPGKTGEDAMDGKVVKIPSDDIQM